jgi:hypothetical protein
METLFKIARYTQENEKFIKTGYDEYQVTYLKGLKPHNLRIVVNGYLTREVINLVDSHSGYKNRILAAIKEYRERGIVFKGNPVVKKLTLIQLKALYAKSITHNVQTYLLPISKEESRDKLTEFGLI